MAVGPAGPAHASVRLHRRRRMRGTCAILCACVPSGCFLP